LPRARKGERGGETRARIVAAAGTLFRERGYLDTTMAAIAAEAGVVVQTLYLTFGSKVAILQAAHDMAVVGDDEPIPVLERDWANDARTEPDGRKALEGVLTNARRINTRVAPIYAAIQAAAADPDVAALLARIRAQRLATMCALAEELATKAGFSQLQSPERAADILYAVASIEFLGLLTVQREWSLDELDAWSYDIAAAQLFPGLPENDSPEPG
jgi:AcrR family transcriptional regulator